MTQAIRVLAATADTVTIGRSDFEALLNAAEDAEDLAALAAHDAEEIRLGRDAARRDYLTADEAERLLNGENPLKVWRDKRGLSQRALAKEAGMQPGYLAEIETGRKPGSSAALRRLSAALDVPMKDLMSRDQRLKQRDHGPVLLFEGPLPGSATGRNNGDSLHATEFPTNADALRAIEKHWTSQQYTIRRIVDKATREQIFDYNELRDVMPGPFRRVPPRSLSD